MIYLLFLLSTISSVSSVALSKVYRKPIHSPSLADSIYFIVNVPVALLYFAIMCKFDLKANFITLIFSVLFSFLCYGGVLFQLRALEHTTMVNVSLFSNGGSIILSTIAGVLVFGEHIPLKSIAGLMFTLLSFSVPYMASKKQKTSLKGFVFCLLLFLNSGLVRIIMKLYHTTPGCMSENLFCFYANVFLAPLVILMQRKDFFAKSTYREMSKYKKSVGLVALAIVLSNFATLISMIIVGKVDLFFSSVFGPAIAICINFLFDVILFKVKIKLNNIFCVIFAIVAMLLMI